MMNKIDQGSNPNEGFEYD